MSAGGIGPARTALAQRLSGTLDEVLELLEKVASDDRMPPIAAAEQATLLQQCLVLCQQAAVERVEPVRTVHHFACTGGTVISKCLAALPNVQLLSELDPLSTLPYMNERPQFAPSDAIAQVRQSSRGASESLLTELFRSEVRVIHRQASSLGQRVVLRDHSHSHYCVGAGIPRRPTLRELLPQELPQLSLVTVRHPLDSFQSLQSSGWVHFEPATLDEYCRRYLAFLDHCSGVSTVRYEDFVAAPSSTVQHMAAVLALPYNEDFADLFDVFELTGDSGRSGNAIGARPRRTPAAELLRAAAESSRYAALCARLGYDAYS